MFRLPADRFVVVDYKTNRLAPLDETLTAWHYRPAALAAQMEAAHYPLQALLYTVALHRYLRWRVRGYDPEAHLGGVLYLFLRGMSNPSFPEMDGQPCGVWSWRPPASVVVALSDLFDQGSHKAVSTIDAGAFEVRLARRAGGLLREFNEAGVLTAADVHVAVRIGRLGGTDDEDALLAAALAVRAPRLGHVCVDLATIRTTASTDLEVPIDLQELRWPKEREWIDRLGDSPLVGVDRPLHLEGATLYLDRFWSEECQVAADLLALAEPAAGDVDIGLLAAGVERLFPAADEPDYQRLAAASAVLRRFSLIAGGPGTGKTTTVARVLALLDEQAAAGGRRPPLVALAAPTGKAAARLEEAVHSEAGTLSLGAGEQARLAQLRGTTLHRLLGFEPGNRSRFRHHRLNRLAHDVVVVDETSMVSLSLMARLVEAVRSDARLILVGDPEQLASVEAGAVLGDIVGPAAGGMRMRSPARERLAAAAGQAVPASEPESGTPIGDGTVVLRRVHRFEGRIGELAEAIQRGDAAGAVALLAGGDAGVCWITDRPCSRPAGRLE